MDGSFEDMILERLDDNEEKVSDRARFKEQLDGNKSIEFDIQDVDPEEAPKIRKYLDRYAKRILGEDEKRKNSN